MASADKEQLGADLSAYVDGELSPQRAREVERLLEESEDARRLLAELRAVARNLGDLPRVRAPGGLSERIRRAAEGWVTSPRRSQAAGARVLRLMTRVVASAAVIVVCLYAGWMMHDRVAPSATSAGGVVADGAQAVNERAGAKGFAHSGQRERLAPAEEITAEVPAVAMRQLQSLGYVGGDADAELDTPVSAADALVAAGRLGVEVDHDTRTFEGAVAVDDASPIVNVVVAPQDVDQFNDTLQLVAAWQHGPFSAGRLGKIESGAARSSGRATAPPQSAGTRGDAGLAGLSQQEFVVQVPPGRVGEALQSLEQQAPRQVQVMMAFKPTELSRVQSMVMLERPSESLGESPVAESETIVQESAPAFARADAPARGRGVVPPETQVSESRRMSPSGGRGRVARQPVQPELGGPTSEKAVERREAAGTEVLSETLRKETVERLAYLDHARDKGAATKGQPLPGAKKQALAEPAAPVSRARSPLVVDVARPASELVRRRAGAVGAAGGFATPQAGIEEGAVVDRSAAGAFFIEKAEELRDDLGGIHSTMLDAVNRAAYGPAPALEGEELGSVTLRVTVLPPPQATQPAAAPSSPEAP